LGRLVRGRPFFWAARLQDRAIERRCRSECVPLRDRRQGLSATLVSASRQRTRTMVRCLPDRTVGESATFSFRDEQGVSPAGVRWRRNWVAEKSAHKRRTRAGKIHESWVSSDRRIGQAKTWGTSLLIIQNWCHGRRDQSI
jgi:hypothetical protein